MLSRFDRLVRAGAPAVDLPEAEEVDPIAGDGEKVLVSEPADLDRRLTATRPLHDSLVTVSLLRSKLPHVKIVDLSTLPVDLGNWVSPEIGLDAIITQEDGLSKLVETLYALMPEPRRD